MTLDEIRTLREVAARVLAAGSTAVVGTLYARDGHSYRDPGAMMVMTEALEVVGGVSGGCLEEYVGRAGRDLLRDRDAAVMSFDTSADVPGRPTLGCGGRLDVLVEQLRPAHLAFLDAAADAMADSDAAAAVCRVEVIGGPDGRVSASRAVVVDGVTAFADRPAVVAATAVPPTRGGFPTVWPAAAGAWADAIDLRECVTRRAGAVVETASYLWPQPRLVVLGARDDTMPLVRVAKAAGWHVTVADRRGRLASADRFPEADAVVADAWDRVVAFVPWKPWTAAVVMTHSFDDDVELVPALAALDVGYVGVLGPSARADRLWSAIPAVDRSRVRTPAGLPLGDKSPGGIAVAIMAELIADRRGRRLVGRPTTDGDAMRQSVGRAAGLGRTG